MASPTMVSHSTTAPHVRVSKLNITSQTLVTDRAGHIARVSVLVAGTTLGAVNDSATVSGTTVSNTIAGIPNAVGVYEVEFPFSRGLVISPGAGQTVAVAYSHS